MPLSTQRLPTWLPRSSLAENGLESNHVSLYLARASVGTGTRQAVLSRGRLE